MKDQFPDSYFSPEVLCRPPPEETLVQNTLWPEVVQGTVYIPYPGPV